MLLEFLISPIKNLKNGPKCKDKAIGVLKKIDQANFKVNNCSKENEGEKEKSHII